MPKEVTDWNEELERICEQSLLVQNTSEDIDTSNIALYGAGSMGAMALDLMRYKNIKPKYIVDTKVKGNLQGIPIFHPDEVSPDEKQNIDMIITIASMPVVPIIDFLRDKGYKKIAHFYDFSEMFMPDIMPNGWVKTHITTEEKKSCRNILKALQHDKNSIHHYLQFLWWRLCRKEVIYEKYPVLSHNKYFDAPHFPQLTQKEILLDAGCHHGQVINAFLKRTCGKFDKIVAFEPDKENLEKAQQTFSDARITFVNKALSSKDGTANFYSGLGYASRLHKEGCITVETCSLDSLAISPTIAKIHTEGNELDILQGGVETIKRTVKKLIVLLDHSEDGLINIPEYILHNFDMKLYFTLHDYCGNSAFLYAYNN